ncbi:MAG TPA: ABC transporter permease [Candidatus Eremiobacteraceae bacterium]|nr:ABC transporter permease [Candidatus Eremiobacteraceae bacterium]
MFGHPAAVFTALSQHIVLSGVALLAALAIALPLGVIAARVPALRLPVFGLLNAIYTIPSLALFALLVPVVGLGFAPAACGLALYALMILVTNVTAGVTSVDPASVDAARGLGMSDTQVLWRVELPLAMPVIVGGVRIASAAVISIATVAALVDAGGFGTLILAGIDQDNLPKALAGAIGCVALALAVDGGLRLLERRVAR